MSSQVSNPNLVKFPLVKFSHHLGSNGTKSHTWTHVNYRNDLEFVLRDMPVIDDHGNHNTRSWMKVTGGSEVLESQNLSQLASLFHEHSSSTDEQPIDVVVKCPFLAMKYPKTTNTVRRIQVKFRKESDFVQVVKILARLGFSIVDKETSTPVSTAILTSQYIPSSISNICNANTSLSKPSPTGLEVFQGGSVSQGRSLLSPTKSNFNNKTMTQLSFPEEHRAQSQILHPNSSAPGNIFNQSGSTLNLASSSPKFLSLEDAENSWSTFQSQNKLEFQNRHMSQPIISKSSFALSDVPRENKHPFLQKNLMDGKIANESNSIELSRMSAQSLSWNLVDEDSFGMQSRDGLSGQAIKSIKDRQNHNYTQMEVLDERKIWIPPKRELPFSKSQEESKTYASLSEDLPPLPKPTPVTQTDDETPISLNDNRFSKNEFSHQKPALRKSKAVKKSTKSQPINKSDAESRKVEEIPFSSAKKSVLRPTTRNSKRISATKRVASKNPVLKSKGKRMIDQSTQTEIESEQDKTFKKNQNNKRTSLSLTDFSAPRIDVFKNHNTKEHSNMIPRAHTHPEGSSEAPNYSESLDEVRHSLVQNFIIENMENKEFIKLCRDLEFSWQRIILGI